MTWDWNRTTAPKSWVKRNVPSSCYSTKLPLKWPRNCMKSTQRERSSWLNTTSYVLTSSKWHQISKVMEFHYNHSIFLWIIIETPLSISTYTFILWKFPAIFNCWTQQVSDIKLPRLCTFRLLSPLHEAKTHIDSKEFAEYIDCSCLFLFILVYFLLDFLWII